MTDFRTHSHIYESIFTRGTFPLRSASQIIDNKELVAFRIISLSRQNRTSEKTIFSSRKISEYILHIEVLGLCVMEKHISNEKIYKLRIPSKDEISEKLKVYNESVEILAQVVSRRHRAYGWTRRIMNEDDYLNRVRLAWRTLGIPAIRKGDSTKVTLPNAFSPVYIRPGEVYTIPRELQRAAPKAFPQSDYPWNRERADARREAAQRAEVWNEPRFEAPQPFDWARANTTGVWGQGMGTDNTTLRVDPNLWPDNTAFTGLRGGGGGTGGVNLTGGITITPPLHFGFDGTNIIDINGGTFYENRTTRAPIERDTPDVRIGNDLETHRREMIEALTSRYNIEATTERPAPLTRRASVRQDRPFYRQGRF